MFIALTAFFVLISILLFPQKAFGSFRIRKEGVFAKVTFKLFFGLIPVRFQIKAVYLPPFGFVLYFGNRSQVLGERKPNSGFDLLRMIDFERIDLTGAVGINDHPALTVQIAGALDMILIQVLLTVFGTAPVVFISPELNENVFALNIDCIAKAELGKMIIKEILFRRRTKNGTSNRKHNAVVNGTYQKAR